MCLCCIYHCPNTKSSTRGTAISTELFLKGSDIFATLVKETDLADGHYKHSKLEGSFLNNIFSPNSIFTAWKEVSGSVACNVIDSVKNSNIRWPFCQGKNLGEKSLYISVNVSHYFCSFYSTRCWELKNSVSERIVSKSRWN